MTRFNILPDPAYENLRSTLVERLDRIAGSLRPEQFDSVLDPLMRRVLERGFADAGADEGTVWLLDGAGEALVPAHNTGPNASRLVGHFKQPLNAGLICMVFASEQPFLENDVAQAPRQSKLLDSLLGVQTCAMMAVPFHFLHACRGVISCVQLQSQDRPAASHSGFRPEHLAGLQLAATLLSQLLEYRLLGRAVGWMSE